MASQRFGDGRSPGYGAIGSRVPGDGDDFTHTPSGANTFEGVSSQISQLVFNINRNVSELQRAQKKINTKDDNLQLRSRVHKTQHEVKSYAAQVTQLLKTLHHTARPNDRQQKLQVERLTNSFKSTIERYDSVQKTVTDLMKTASLQIGAQDFNEEQDTWSEEASLLEKQRRREQLQQQQLIVEDDLAMARDREERIRQIEVETDKRVLESVVSTSAISEHTGASMMGHKSAAVESMLASLTAGMTASDILDVNGIFKELGAMVFEQGEQIDEIEGNVTSAADNVEEGKVQLQQAEKYQKSYRKKLCILAVIIIVVAGVLALILGLTLSKKK